MNQGTRDHSDPSLRGVAGWPLVRTIIVAWIAGAVVVLGVYWLIAVFVDIDDSPITSAQRITAAFAAATAAGAIVALLVNLRRQDLNEQLARRDIERAFAEQFRGASNQLGSLSAAERLAGVYAMATLADEYHSRRQQCVDVLCGYLRLPFDPDTDNVTDRTTDVTQAFADRRTVTTHSTDASPPHDQQVRSTIITVIRAHTQSDATPSWSDLTYDFTGAHLHNLNLERAMFSGETSFDGAMFSGNLTVLTGATFSGWWTSFEGAVFPGGTDRPKRDDHDHRGPAS